MKIRISTSTVIIALVFTLGVSLASAQSLSSVMTVLDRLEARLHKLEAAQKKDMKRIQNQLSNIQPDRDISSVEGSVSTLQSRMNNLALELEQIKNETSNTEDIEIVSAIAKDLRELIGGLRETIETSNGIGKNGSNGSQQISNTPKSQVSKQSVKVNNSKGSNLPSVAQKGKISGYMIGDYYWVAANHDSTADGKDGFWFRRIYLTYDQALNSSFDFRFRLEMNSPGDFHSSVKMEPVVKDAYLRWKYKNHQILFGISPTPTWSVVEKTWGYRSVEKTPADLQKLGGSRDFGLGFKGALDAGKKVKYHFMIANGAGNKSETNKEKKVMLALGFNPNASVVLEVYGDYEAKPGDRDRYTFHAFAAYKTKKGRVGVQFEHQTRKGATDESLEIGSVFGVLKVSPKVNLLARVDKMFYANPDGAKISYIPFSPSAKSTLVLVGLDFSPGKNVHLIPNIETVLYDAAGNGQGDPETDVIPRLTFYYKF